MPSINKVILIGHLGSDPEVRYMQDGTAIANVSLATSFRWKDRQSGEDKEETEWHRLTFRARLAEVVGEYLKKGAAIYVEGRLRTRKWQDKEGHDRYTTEVIVNDLKMIGGKPSEERAAPEKKKEERPAPAKKPAGKFDDMADDIPF